MFLVFRFAFGLRQFSWDLLEQVNRLKNVLILFSFIGDYTSWSIVSSSSLVIISHAMSSNVSPTGSSSNRTMFVVVSTVDLVSELSTYLSRRSYFG